MHSKKDSVIYCFRQAIALFQIPYKSIIIFSSLISRKYYNIIIHFNQIDKSRLNCYDMKVLEEKDGY
jgi:hypothetical protein